MAGSGLAPSPIARSAIRACLRWRRIKFVIDPQNPYPNNYTGHIRVTLKDGSVIEERQPHLRGGAKEPLTRQDVIDKFVLNAAHGGWTKPQGDAALKLLAALYRGRIDLSTLRG